MYKRQKQMEIIIKNANASEFIQVAKSFSEKSGFCLPMLLLLFFKVAIL